jgi:hypothetical protein
VDAPKGMGSTAGLLPVTGIYQSTEDPLLEYYIAIVDITTSGGSKNTGTFMRILSTITGDAKGYADRVLETLRKKVSHATRELLLFSSDVFRREGRRQYHFMSLRK